MKTIGIVGTRRRDTNDDCWKVEEVFRVLYKKGDRICSGGCYKGGDRFAEAIARKLGIPILIFHPDWRTYGKGAGLIRNSDIAKNSDSLIACVSEDRTGGTEDTIKKFNDKDNLYLV